MHEPNSRSDDPHVRIYTRGKKKIYCADFWYRGKHRRESLRTKNLRTAQIRANELLRHLDDQIGSSQSMPAKIAEARTLFLDYLRTESRRPKTIKKYAGFLRAFEAFCNDRQILALRHVSSLHIDRFRAQRKPTHAAKSMQNEGVMLKAFFRWAKQRKLSAENPLAEMRFAKPVTPTREAPTLAQVDAILATATGERRTELAILAFTGMRVGDVQRLRREDVDLVGNWIHVVSRDGLETKTGLSRKVPIHPRLRGLLNAKRPGKGPWYFCARPSKKFPAGDHWINTKRVNEDFISVLKTLGIPAGRFEGFTVHSLRSFFKTFCVNARIPKPVVDIWQGHALGNSASNAYYKLSDEQSQSFMAEVPFGTGKPAGANTTGDEK